MILCVWIILGVVFWFKIRKNFLYGKWAGVSVEEILLHKTASKFSEDHSNTPG